MPFTLIKGRYTPNLGIAEGDTVRYVADNLELWNRLDGRGVKINESNHSVSLRLEGIDALERNATTPLSVKAKEIC